MAVYLTELDPAQLWFPPVEHALEQPDGLLAMGGIYQLNGCCWHTKAVFSRGSALTTRCFGGAPLPGLSSRQAL